LYFTLIYQNGTPARINPIDASDCSGTRAKGIMTRNIATQQNIIGVLSQTLYGLSLNIKLALQLL